ncbi:MAG TPA: YdbL family protein [Opitutaceae bacterium]
MKTLARILVSLLITLPLVAQAADDAGTINRRMAERLPAIDALKERLVIGETNSGMVEARSTVTAEEEQLVAAENSDRAAVYALIARAQSTSAEAVGKARARQIAERSKPGLWLQAQDGKWYQKK